ncbi:hypothetical protein KFL_004980010 [Klebsormidium nitens]|uniref:Secreted protein n=1 Tax=Klebsormidium nitens TaxID=105231 RepID=A0A1Y1IF16_KLENI|nr:hypothetical protein KFL_004980010 [Klebsormidium nitens]|eukprot:GAQ89213.1 hypothetical protein KFL_004980010 [Klebsormidium nitens]
MVVVSSLLLILADRTFNFTLTTGISIDGELMSPTKSNRPCKLAYCWRGRSTDWTRSHRHESKADCKAPTSSLAHCCCVPTTAHVSPCEPTHCWRSATAYLERAFYQARRLAVWAGVRRRANLVAKVCSPPITAREPVCCWRSALAHLERGSTKQVRHAGGL